MSSFISAVFEQAWSLLLESSVYILFGLIISGLLRVFLNPSSVARHFAKGRFRSVFKAALLGIPIPLCSCGVLPAAVGLRKQGANRGATTAFLISTPESGIDSISITYALLDPIMTVARPVAAFVTAAAAGIAENLFSHNNREDVVDPDLSCPVDACCDGHDCSPEAHRHHHTLVQKIAAGFRFAFTEVWADMAGWFLIGLVLAGLITTMIPGDWISHYLGGGLPSMLLMLAIGIPLYICATASTPIAAALILKGVSPGAALVFLMAGPATNITSLTVLLGTLGKRATAIYLTTIALSSILFGLAVDQVYGYFGFSAQAMVGQTAEFIPGWVQWAGALIILALSVHPLYKSLGSRLRPKKRAPRGDTLEMARDTLPCTGSG
ncbi:MAG: SO_0444 family Cu/Zn efflux transporter [Deltaproteobacteria bacterium]|nr:SO_0444 family Cu/Zn efflux transporter [Deltaproteobacteria bacterium]